jgi:hypothetical protein
MATLIAPTPYAVFITRGLRYTADANSLIVATSPTDIQDLIESGCMISNSPSVFNTSVVPVVTNGPYSAGDIVGGLMTFAVAPGIDVPFQLDAIQITFKSAVTPSLTVLLFNDTPNSTTTTDNAPYSLNAADAFKVVLPMPLTALGGYLTDHGTPNTYTLGGLGIKLRPVSGTSNILLLVVDGTGVTLTSTSDMQVTLYGSRA